MKRGFIVALLCFVVPIAAACCLTYGPNRVDLTSETAILIYDRDSKTEHFIRSAMFQGKAKDFGFIFPSPTEPHEIEAVDSQAFDTLESVIPKDGAMETAGSTKSDAGSVEVLSQKIVGDFEATVLQASDGKAMGNWLTKNGHQMRPAMTPWLDHYAKQRWVFTALKYLGRIADKPTKAVRISFRTDKPHYPYKMPSDTFSPSHYRPITLYVVSQSPLKGSYTDQRPWEGRESPHAKLNAGYTAQLSEQLGIKGKPLDLPANMSVSRFYNVPEASNYDFDIVFEPAPEPPYIALYIALGGLLTAGYAFLRRSKISPDELNPRYGQP